MEISSLERALPMHEIWAEMLRPYEHGIAWISDQRGNNLASTPGLKKIPLTDFEQVWPKHKFQIDSGNLSSKNTFLDFYFGLNHELSGLFSCRKIKIENQTFFLLHKVNPQNELHLTNDQLIAEEFGIYSWQFHLESNHFFFAQEATKRFFNRTDSTIEYADFYGSLSVESLHRFSEAMESAINFGQGFRLELMLEQTSKIQWISFSCQPTHDNTNSVWLTGLIKDLQNDKKDEIQKHHLEQWLNVGLAKLEVKDADGEILANWGKNLQGPHIKIENGKRSSTIYDFRNRPKFLISAETGIPEITDYKPKPIDNSRPAPLQSSENELLNTLPQKETSEPVPDILPIDKLNKEEKCVALTQWLGQSLDVQVSAIGIFDGSRFEWKAWWKSPNRFALPIKRYAGEWLPELDWLVDVETDNQKFTDRYWWPQDMLPFQIAESFGDGWMLLAEPISTNETTVFAIKTNDPECIKEKTQHVLKSLDLLKDAPVLPKVATLDELHAELARKDMLIKEMNHRAKNNLALAASLVKMEAGFSDDINSNHILKQTQKRLETLASIHELMYLSPNESGSVDIKEYLKQLTDGLLSSFGNPDIRMELHVDSVKISMKVANTIGLLVNELISNAFKHAFSLGNPGILKIDFLEKGETYKLRVCDNGPGFKPDHKSTTSLGNILIDEFVKQLHGTMDIDTTLGTTYLISFKKSIIDA